MGNFHCDSIPPLYPTNVGHGNMNVSFPMSWHPYEFKHDTKGENSRFNNNGFSFRPNSSLPYESCPIGPLPDVVPRGQQYQQPSSLVNISSVNHTSSSVSSFPMEPPSCQSYCSSYSPLWPDEEKMMIGTKRPCPFPLDNPLIPTFHSKLATISSHPTSLSDESTVCGNGGTRFNFDPIIPVFKEVPSCPSTMLENKNSKKSNKSEKDNPSEEFLTLALPAIIRPFPTSRLLKQTSTYLASLSRELFSIEHLPYQRSIEDIIMDSGQGEPSQRPNFFNFFPAKKMQLASVPLPTSRNNFNGEVEESIDLNLRL